MPKCLATHLATSMCVGTSLASGVSEVGWHKLPGGPWGTSLQPRRRPRIEHCRRGAHSKSSNQCSARVPPKGPTPATQQTTSGKVALGIGHVPLFQMSTGELRVWELRGGTSEPCTSRVASHPSWQSSTGGGRALGFVRCAGLEGAARAERRTSTTRGTKIRQIVERVHEHTGLYTCARVLAQGGRGSQSRCLGEPCARTRGQARAE
jgi:hypothetical protein